MAIIESNILQLRRIMQRETLDGQQTFREVLQYRTKNITSAVLGLISWSSWQSLELSDLI